MREGEREGVERESGQDREKEREREVVLRPGPDLYPLIN